MRIRYNQWEQYCRSAAINFPTSTLVASSSAPSLMKVIDEPSTSIDSHQEEVDTAMASSNKRKKRFFHDGPLPASVDSLEQPKVIEPPRPSFVGPICFSIGAGAAGNGTGDTSDPSLQVVIY
jgi:hypothetical protein